MRGNLSSFFCGKGQDPRKYAAWPCLGPWRTRRQIPSNHRSTYRGSHRVAAHRGGRRRAARGRSVSRLRLARKIAARRARRFARTPGRPRRPPASRSRQPQGKDSARPELAAYRDAAAGPRR